MTEDQLLYEVTELAYGKHIKVAHIEDARRNPTTKGMPDLILIGSHHLIWRELKVGIRNLSVHQVNWKYLLKQTGQDFDVWTERDLWDGRVEVELDELNRA